MEFERGAAPRGAEVVAATNALTGMYPAYPLQLVVCQETGVAADTIQAAFIGTPPFAATFSQPPLLSREHLPVPAQPFRIPPSRAYRMSYMNAGPAGMNMAAVGGFNLVNLDPVIDAGVAAWIAAQGLAPGILFQVNQCAANMRWPGYQQYTYGGSNVHFRIS